jgi:chanoclavine-I dehydrogenase
MSFKDRVISVTGGASGMGAATCRLLAEKGAKAICVGDYNTANFESLTAELKAISPKTEILFTKLDVQKSAEVDKWVEDIVAKFGRLDGCANVAGVPQPVGVRGKPAILEETDDSWNRTLGVNLNGIFYCTRAQVRAMLKQPKEKHPSIVNVSSIGSMLHTPDCFAYGASKRAAASFSSSVAKDVYSFGIRVNTVSPGMWLMIYGLPLFSFLAVLMWD